MVEIIKNICCLSVVKDYILFRKYNLQEVVKSGKGEEQENTSNVSQEGNLEEAKPVEEKVEPK